MRPTAGAIKGSEFSPTSFNFLNNFQIELIQAGLLLPQGSLPVEDLVIASMC
jgi:hypothetical protein